MAIPGHPVDAAELEALGFQRLSLRFHHAEIAIHQGVGRDWDTLGVVPDAPGIYLFSIEEEGRLNVAYVGMTEHLWMVTKGRLVQGGARGGQRYGRPKHAGVTRARINVLVAEQVRTGRVVAHWVRPLRAFIADREDLRRVLRDDEEGLIRLWRLRETGWNRG